MKVFAKNYKTYEGARKRMLFEQAHAKTKTWVWGVRIMGEKRFHVVRWPRAEYRREKAIAVALAALGVGVGNSGEVRDNLAGSAR